jgi:hypothetical protein
MATLHKVEVFAGAVTVYHWAGEQVEVHGEPMVRLGHGTIVKSDGYHASLADAKRQAADRIDAVRADLAAQAAQLRQEANAWNG